MADYINTDTIETLEAKLRETKNAYLRLHGWTRTCNTPGSFWVWTRDFADIDEKRKAYHPPKASPFVPYGFVMAETDLAVMMTQRCLEPPPIDEEGE